MRGYLDAERITYKRGGLNDSMNARWPGSVQAFSGPLLPNVAPAL